MIDASGNSLGLLFDWPGRFIEHVYFHEDIDSDAYFCCYIGRRSRGWLFALA
jgi:hypothetical protein